MGKQYMDYGSIISKDTYTIPKNLTLVDYNKKGLVYRLTHDGEGKSLSFMNKAFISFTYGGKKIEDFGLIAITVNDRLLRLTPPAHEDYTTEYKMLNGQYYWGSHYNARELIITLATDGMTQLLLDNFKHWFQPGEIRELILSEHPNRGILARVALAPQISILPFKRLSYTMINLKQILNNIIEYKGNIQLTFVMDDPFWYAIKDVLGDLEQDLNGYYRLVDQWVDENGNLNNSLNLDAYKVIIEDKIPTGNMFSTEINLGNDIKVIPDKQYKYTLTDDIVEAKIDGSLVGGTPLINEVDDNGKELDTYPISGGIVGPLFLRSFNYNGNITYIDSLWVKQNQMVSLDRNDNNTLGNIVASDYPDEYVITRLLSAKAGSTISLISPYSESQVCIILYDKNNKKFIEEKWLYNEVINETESKVINNFILDKDYYIRLYVSIFDLRHDIEYSSNEQNIGVYDINNIVEVNIITFNEQNNTVKKVLFDNKITEIKLDWFSVGLKIELFSGILISAVDEEVQSKTPYIAMTKFLPIKAGSIIKKNNDNIATFKYLDRLEGFIYDINDTNTLIDHFFVNNTYEFLLSCYIRFNIIFKENVIPTVKLINSLFDFELYTIQENNLAYYFYSGNAPSYPEVNFSVPFHFNNYGFIDTFNSSDTNDENNYNTLTLESEFKHELKLTNPSVITSYNQVIAKLLDNSTTNMAISLAIQAFRLLISHPIIRNWIINCINIYQHTYNSQLEINDSNKLLTLTDEMKHMLLLYMPYVFANYSALNMQLFDSDPIEVYAPKEITVDYDNRTKKIINEKYVDGREKVIRAIKTNSLSIALLTNNVLYYQWEFSLDGNKWYVMQDKGAWVGSTTSNLKCLNDGNNGHIGIASNDFNKYYRCLVSNNDEAKYSDIIQILEEDSTLRFQAFPPDILDKDFGSTVVLEWRAKNYNSGLTRILYHAPGNEQWVVLVDNVLTEAITDRVLTDLGGLIHFEFKISSAEINGYWFSVAIKNDYNDPLNAVDNIEQIEYHGTILDVNNTLSTNSSLTSISYREYGSSDSFSGDYNYNSTFQIALGKEIKIAVNNVFNTIEGSCFEVSIDQINWTNATLSSSNFYKSHLITPASLYNGFSITWVAKLTDNNYYFRFNAKGINEQQQYLPSESGFKLNRIVSKSLELLAPIYTETNIKQYVGKNFSINIQDNNQGQVTYAWYYKANEAAAQWMQVVANNIITGVNTDTLTFTNVTLAQAGLYKIVLTKNGNTYNDNNKYIKVEIYNKLTIKNDLSASAVTDLSYYNYQLNDECPITLTCSANYADDCNWFYVINNTSTLLTTVTKNNENNILTTTLTTSIFTYKQLQGNVQFYCRFINNTSKDTKLTNTVMVTVKLQPLPSVNILPLYSVHWDWRWPLNIVEVERGVVISEYSTWALVMCKCEYDEFFKFEGVPPRKVISVEDDGVPWASGQQDVLNAMYNTYLSNALYAVPKKIGTIKINNLLANIKWQTIILKIDKITSNKKYFDFMFKVTYHYNDSSKDYTSNELGASSNGVTIFSESIYQYYDVNYIDILVQPYFKIPWSLFNQDVNKKLTCDWTNYHYDYWFSDGTHVDAHLLTLTNMLGSSIKLSAIGIPETTGSRGTKKLLNRAAPTLLGAIADDSSALAKNVNITFKHYHPTYLESRLIEVTVTDVNQFLKAMNNNGENKIYRFVYDARLNNYTGGWNYNGIFYQVAPPGISIDYEEGKIKIFYDDNGHIIDTIHTIWCRTGTILLVNVEFINVGNSVVDQDLSINLDCKQGLYEATYYYNIIKWPGALLSDLQLPEAICLLSSLRYKESYSTTEEVGDMILYNNFIFDEQNHFNNYGKLLKWNLNDKKLSYKVSYDGNIPLYHFNLNYKNYYL